MSAWSIEKDLTRINNKTDLIKYLDIQGKQDHIFKDHVDVPVDRLMEAAVANMKLNGNGTINGNQKYTGRDLTLSYIKNVIVNNQDQIDEWLKMRRPRETNPETEEKYRMLKVSKRYKHTGQSVKFNAETMEFEVYNTNELTVALRRSFKPEHPFGFRTYTAYASNTYGDPVFTKSAEEFFDEHPEFTQSKKLAYIMANKYNTEGSEIKVGHEPFNNVCIIKKDNAGYSIDAELRDDLVPAFKLNIDGKKIDITDGKKLKDIFTDKSNKDIPLSIKTEEVLEDIKKFKAEIGCKFKQPEALLNNEDFKDLNKKPATKEKQEAKEKLGLGNDHVIRTSLKQKL